jgi:hypothetical protein
MRFRDVIRQLAEQARAQAVADAVESVGDVPEVEPIEFDSPADAQAAIRAVFGKKATSWLAEQAGIKLRTAQRWMSAGIPTSREDVLIALAEALVTYLAQTEAAEAHAALVEAARQAAEEAAAAAGVAMAAPMLAGHTGADVGAVTVAYDDEDDGDRYIAHVDIDFDPIVGALEDGDEDLAEELFGAAVLDSYGGLGETLTIADYHGGIELT